MVVNTFVKKTKLLPHVAKGGGLAAMCVGQLQMARDAALKWKWGKPTNTLSWKHKHARRIVGTTIAFRSAAAELQKRAHSLDIDGL